MPGQPDDTTVSVQPPPSLSFAALSGLDTVTTRLTEAVVTPATEDRLAAVGASGVLLHGPAGVGKTRVARALVGELDFTLIEVSPADVELARPDEAAATVDDISRSLADHEPCVLVVDGIDTLAPAATDDRSDQVVVELCNLLDDLDAGDRRVLFVGTTTELAAVDERVRRAGRVDLTVGIEKPDFQRRCAILRDELAAVDAAAVEMERLDVDRLAGWTDGFSAAAVVEVVERAVRKCGVTGTLDTEHFARAVEELHDVEDFRTPAPDDGDEDDDGTDPFDFTDVLPGDGDVTSPDGDSGDFVTGSAVPDVGFEDVGGLDAVEQRLRELVAWPRQYPERFAALDVDTAKGVLLYGPPGTGKTLLAKAIANETDSTFLAVDGPELLDRYVGESERFVRELFATAQDRAPSVVFIDEIDAIGGRRGGYSGGGGVQDTIVNQFLSELDGLTGLEDVVVIGATNRIEVIDPALTRPGRLGEAIHVPPPDDEGRREVFEIHTETRLLADDVDVDWLVDRTSRAYTGADVEALCERAAMNAIRDAVDANVDADEEIRIAREHFERALAAFDPSGGSDGPPTGRAFR